MSLSEQEVRALLATQKLRVTAPRVAVLQLLASSERPLSHTEVVEALSGSTWDQATLFRNLIKLTESGLTRVTSELSGVKRYELVKPQTKTAHLAHPHFVCNACGVVSCLPESVVTPQANVSALGEEWSGALSNASIHILGVCPPCQSAS